MTEKAWQPPQSSPRPASPPPPTYSTPRKFRRSRTDRKICGVAGGLAEYLSVDATVLRVGFVIVSVMFLAGFGGVVLYLIVCAVVPEEGDERPVAGGAFSGRPWHDWDRSARSWALVFGALALAFVWSFGLWPWWHWGALPVWLLLTGLAIWAFAYHRPGIAQTWPFRWDQSTTEPPQAATMGPSTVGTTEVSADPDAQSAQDVAKARQAAAEWAKTQLAAAGVPVTSPSTLAGSSALSGTSTPRAAYPRPARGLWWAVKTLCSLLGALVLLAAVGVVGVTTFSGASLRGGFGEVTNVPATASSVKTHYRLGVGELDLDLSGLTFPVKGQIVSVSVGIGELKVEVPKDAVVTVRAQSNLGDVTVFGHSGSDVDTGSYGNIRAARAPHLTLDARVGVGKIIVTRG